jgi:hypothetical protein
LQDDNIFDSNTNEDQTAGNTAEPVFQIPTEASEFIGSGKKYQSVDEALKSVPHAQKHIQTLESELANVKEELLKRRTTEELIDTFKSDYQPEYTPQGESFDQDRLYEVVDQTIAARERQKVAKQNTNQVVGKLTEKFGDRAEEAYINIAKESGLTIQQLNVLASSSPGAVLKLAGLSVSQSTSAPTSQGTINTQALSQNNQQTSLSSRVPKGATTKEMVNAWKTAGEKIKQTANT